MSKQSLDKVREMLCEELDVIAKRGTLDSGYLETLHKLTDTIKNIDKIKMLDEGQQSNDPYSPYEMSNRRMSRNSYDNNSYADNSYADYSGRRYSRGGNEEARQKLQEMMRTGRMDEVTLREVMNML